MGDISPAHILLSLLVLVGVAVLALVLTYRHGRKVGDQHGYIRGYKDGQQNK
jgi:hypothetical protein